jgi:hypothetical protein
MPGNVFGALPAGFDFLKVAIKVFEIGIHHTLLMTDLACG